MDSRTHMERPTRMYQASFSRSSDRRDASGGAPAAAVAVKGAQFSAASHNLVLEDASEGYRRPQPRRQALNSLLQVNTSRSKLMLHGWKTSVHHDVTHSPRRRIE